MVVELQQASAVRAPQFGNPRPVVRTRFHSASASDGRTSPLGRATSALCAAIVFKRFCAVFSASVGMRKAVTRPRTMTDSPTPQRGWSLPSRGGTAVGRVRCRPLGEGSMFSRRSLRARSPGLTFSPNQGGLGPCPPPVASVRS